MSADPENDDVFARRAEIEAAADPARYTTLRRLAEDPSRRLVVCLGGGAVPGLCGNAMLLGLLEDLDLCGRVAEVWGTSAGAVIGAAWAGGRTIADLVPLGKKLARPEVLDVSRIKLALALLARPFGRSLPDGLSRGRRVRAALREMIPVDRIEDCRIPFRCLAVVDDGSLRRKVFRRGPVVPAVYGSMSIPGLFEPAPPEGKEGFGYLDGGLSEKTPLLSAIAEHRRVGGDKELVLLSTWFGADAPRVAPRGFIRRFLHAIDALQDVAWKHQVAEARRQHGVAVLLLKSGIDDPSLFDFERVEENLLQARASLKQALSDAHIAAALGTG